MTTQYKVDARAGDQALPPVQPRSSAAGWRPDFVPRKPMPAGRAQNEYSVEEHLMVQREIEERARRIWLANGGAPQSPLDDWLKAEAEVLAEFVKNLMPCNPGKSVSRKPQKNRAPSTMRPEIPHQLPNRLKQESTAAIQYNL